MKAKTILHTERLCIGYSRKGEHNYEVLQNLNLKIHPGDVVCVLGANGSGKSTLIRSLAGLQPILGGKIFIENEPVDYKHPKKIAQLLSVVLTDRIDVLNLSVYDLVAMGRYPYSKWFGKAVEVNRDLIYKALEQVHLMEFTTRPLHELSDGELQRAMIAKALVQDTPVILLDEPTAHLDLPNRIETMQLLRKLAKETDKAVLLSTHDLELALQTADILWLLTRHGPVQTGLPEDMVLNGSFEATFQNENVRFDPESGSYRINFPTNRKYKIIGNSVTGFWTKRAFEREGILLDPEVEGYFSIRVQERHPKWAVLSEQGDEYQFYSIRELLRFVHQLKK